MNCNCVAIPFANGKSYKVHPLMFTRKNLEFLIILDGMRNGNNADASALLTVYDVMVSALSVHHSKEEAEEALASIELLGFGDPVMQAIIKKLIPAIAPALEEEA